MRFSGIVRYFLLSVSILPVTSEWSTVIMFRIFEREYVTTEHWYALIERQFDQVTLSVEGQCPSRTTYRYSEYTEQQWR